MTSAAGGRRGAGRPGCNRHVRARGGGGSGMRGAERQAGGARGRPGPSPSRALPSGSRGRGDECHPRLPGAPPELPLTWRTGGGREGGRTEPDTPHCPAATGMAPSCGADAGLAVRDARTGGGGCREAGGRRATSASAGGRGENASGARTLERRSESAEL